MKITSLGEMSTDMVSNTDFVSIIMIILLFLIVSSDVFVNHVLVRISGAVDMKSPTNYGVFIQGIALAIAYAIYDATKGGTESR